MAELLYHAEDDTESPFDSAILRVAQSGPVRIVSPYIGMVYLQRIVDIQPEWKLLSDVEEWLRAASVADRPKAWTFIREHLSQIHHVPALHAKAVIADSVAMMGSANLTQKGVLGRTELGILLDDPILVTDLCAWFDRIWASTTPPLIDEASAFVQWLDEEAAQAPAKRQRFALSSDSRKVRAHLVKLDTSKLVEIATTNTPLDLGVVAQAVIAEDQRRYDSLKASLEASIDKLTALGTFGFGQIVMSVKIGYPTASTREIYFLLLQHCANHCRSVFVAETINRLIINDGYFTQSTHDALPTALAPFDAFLAALIEHLSFVEALHLPSEENLEEETGFTGPAQVILVSELIECGLLVLHDIPGYLPRYWLDSRFEWSGRFNLFSKAHSVWLSKERVKQSARMSINDPDDSGSHENLYHIDNLHEQGSRQLVDVTGIDDLMRKYADREAKRLMLVEHYREEKRKDKAALKAGLSSEPLLPPNFEKPVT
jgi:hypothetical protein